jgi:hypothetical protein
MISQEPSVIPKVIDRRKSKFKSLYKSTKKNEACHKDAETERGGKMEIHNRKLLKKLTSYL